ncbi:MAG: DUF444 family protein [Xanthomonadales bacterium]|nr:DUF444 family protein [Xanthomonadales bacterium]
MPDRISSEESEGLFGDFIDEKLSDLVERAISEGELEQAPGDGSELIVEMDDIAPPEFTYGDTGGGGGGGQGPGDQGGKLRFGVSFDRFMELAAERLNLPDLTKEGRGKIKQVSYEFKTFGPTGVVLDRKRTFKRAVKSSIAVGEYRPDEDRYTVSIRRRDRRFKQPQRIEKPRFRAACFYVGDISYSTYGDRLELEKRLLSFIHHWLDFNYGHNKVEHRFFVHDVEAYEVTPDEFYQVSNIGGTRASMAFDLVARVARNEYDPNTTNLYCFYVGDGELLRQDAAEIVEIVQEQLRPAFNRLSVVEIKPSAHSCLVNFINRQFNEDRKVRASVMHRKQDVIPTIKHLLGSGRA